MRVADGAISFLNAYASQSGISFEMRETYYNELHDVYTKGRVHGPTVILGDFNARLHRLMAGEEDILGPYIFGYSFHIPSPHNSRELLLELCRSHGLVGGNTWFNEKNANW